MSYQQAQIKRQVLHAMAATGTAVRAVCTRQETDENGMATGETTTVCTMQAMRYTKQNAMASVLMATIGITTGNESAPKCCGIVLHGDMPRIGDHIAFADAGKTEADILRVSVSMGVLAELVLTR